MNLTFRAGCIILAVTLGGCDLLSLHPQDMSVQTIPAPTQGMLQPYADGETVSLQTRPGDCAKVTCHVYKNGRWRPMEKETTRDLPLLAVEAATGPEYSETLWRPVGASENAILLNRKSGEDNVEAGLFDGLRIGLRDALGNNYATAYAVETGEFLKANNQCLRNDGANRSTDCAPAVGKDLYMSRADIQVFVSGPKAWLLHRRADGSVNLVDLFALNSRPETVVCLSGLVLAMKQTEPPVEIALSPSLFVSRPLDRDLSNSRRASHLRCMLEKTKGLP